MTNSKKTKAQLIEELAAARRRVAALEAEQEQTRQQLRQWATLVFYYARLVGTLQAQAEQIRKELSERDILLQEIHHRVKNDLQIVSSLLFVQSEHLQDQLVRTMFIDLQNRIRAMALIHEKLYQTGEWAKIDFAGYVRDLSAYLFQSYQVNPAAVTLEVSFENVFLPANTAIPCGLIITELISNSLKHAFPAGLGRTGQIRIDFEMMADDRFVLVVSDNGVGLPEAIELQRTETLGLQLVRMLTRQLGGVIGIERNLGTTFKITFRA